MTQITMDHPSRGGFRELTAAEIDVVCGGAGDSRQENIDALRERRRESQCSVIGSITGGALGWTGGFAMTAVAGPEAGIPFGMFLDAVGTQSAQTACMSVTTTPSFDGGSGPQARRK